MHASYSYTDTYQYTRAEGMTTHFIVLAKSFVSVLGIHGFGYTPCTEFCVHALVYQFYTYMQLLFVSVVS